MFQAINLSRFFPLFENSLHRWIMDDRFNFETLKANYHVKVKCIIKLSIITLKNKMALNRHLGKVNFVSCQHPE